MDQPLRAHTLNEVRCYLVVTPCPACQSGPQIIRHTAEAQDGLVDVDAECEHCGGQQTLRVHCERRVPATGPESEIISDDPEPSALVDLHQWLSLFYMLIESASSQDDPAQTRRQGFRAALCLEEALKFYAENEELPPETAFTTDAGKDAYRNFPEKFARQRLIDMRAKLPTRGVMASNVSRDEHRSRKRWWQFWK